MDLSEKNQAEFDHRQKIIEPTDFGVNIMTGLSVHPQSVAPPSPAPIQPNQSPPPKAPAPKAPAPQPPASEIQFITPPSPAPIQPNQSPPPKAPAPQPTAPLNNDFVPTIIKPAKGLNSLTIGGVSLKEKIFFTKNLGIMLKAGVTIPAALQNFLEQTNSRPLKKIMGAVYGQIQQGHSLSHALAAHPRTFDQFFVSLVEIGEESGTLEASMDFIGRQLKKDYLLKRKVTGAMLYPTIILGATFIIGGFISIFILPKMVEFFATFKTDLPVATKILLALANFMKNHGILAFAGAAIFMVAFYLAVRLPFIKPVWHRIILRIPVFGTMVLYTQLARFARNMGILLKNGVTAPRGLEVSAHTFSNVKFKNDLIKVLEEVKKGKEIGATLGQKKFWEFPPIMSRMVQAGEKTGNLDRILLYLADFYEGEVDNIAKNLSTILEPFLLIAIGLVVGFVALAIITPIYNLTGSIKSH